MQPIEFTTDLARRAGNLLLDYARNGNLHRHIKADQTIVTAADLAADQLIAAAIRAQFPGEAILSEEAQTRLPDVNGAVWVIDPLDGTANYSAGAPIWGISIARLVNGMPDSGVLYFPVMDEMVYAQRGRGAFINGAPLRISDENPERLFICCSRTPQHYRIALPYKTRIFGSVAFNMFSVARGHAAANFEYAPKVWDVAAAWLIVEEAGGVVEAVNGQSPFPLQANLDYQQVRFSSLAAVSAAEADSVRQGLQR